MFKGIDVSVFQGVIDWDKVKAAGVQFAMLRGGYGRSGKDERFESNYKKAKKAGVPVGVYHYSYADSIEKAKAEAQFCISYLKGKTLEYPIAFDIEEKTQAILTNERRTDIVKAFCDAMEKAGYYVVIYSSKDWLVNKLNMSKLRAYDVWVAQWAAQCTYTGNYGMWQFSDKGRVDGINGYVDLDYAYKNYPSIMKAAGLNGYFKVDIPKEKPTKPKKPAKPKLKSLDEVAKEVIRGDWGNGLVRKQRLKKAGYDAKAVQKRVNELLK